MEICGQRSVGILPAHTDCWADGCKRRQQLCNGQGRRRGSQGASKLLGKKITYAGHGDFDDFETQLRKTGSPMRNTGIPSWLAYDLRLMFEGFVERGFSNTEDQPARFVALLGHQPAVATQLGFAPIELGRLDQGGAPLHAVNGGEPGGLLFQNVEKLIGENYE